MNEWMYEYLMYQMAAFQAERNRVKPSVDEAKYLAEIDSLKAALFQERQQLQEKTLKMGTQNAIFDVFFEIHGLYI